MQFNLIFIAKEANTMNKTIAKTLLLATMVISSGWGSEFVESRLYNSWIFACVAPHNLAHDTDTICRQLHNSVRAIQKDTIPQLEKAKNELEQKIKNVNDEIFRRISYNHEVASIWTNNTNARIDQLKTTVDTNKSELQIALEAATNRVSQLQAAFNTTNTTVAANKVAITNTVSQLQNVVTENNAALTNRIAQLENTVQMQNAVNLELKNRIEEQNSRISLILKLFGE